MLRHLIRTTFAGVLSLFVLITVTFFLMHAIPNGPFSPDDDRRVPPQVIEAINERYGLNDPVHIQYVKYIGRLLKGDLGVSFKQLDVSVNKLIGLGFPVSAKLGTVAVIFSILFGIPLGIFSAIYKGKFIDWFSRIIATIGVSVPSFVLSTFLLFFFCGYLKLLPSTGLGTWKHYILPTVGLSLAPIAYITRLTRSSMLETMEQDYIRTARAKGVSEFWVIVKHALRNSIIPVVAYVGPLIAALLTGAFIIEYLFSIPGIGKAYVNSIYARDYSLTLGITIFFGGLLIVCNILVDFVYAIIDPRIKFDK